MTINIKFKDVCLFMHLHSFFSKVRVHINVDCNAAFLDSGVQQSTRSSPYVNERNHTSLIKRAIHHTGYSSHNDVHR